MTNPADPTTRRAAGRLVPRAALGRIALVALLAALASAIFTVRVAREMPDFDVYWRAGVRAAAAEPLYRAEDEHYLLKYLPAFAILAIPLGALPRDAAAGLWFIGSLAALGGLLAASVRLLPERRVSPAVLVGATLVVFGKFYARELLLGQVNLFMALATVAAVLLIQRRHTAAGGALVPLALVLKPYAVLLLPWLAAARQITACVAAGAGLVVVLLLPAAVYGPRGALELHAAWLDIIVTSSAPNLLNPDNVSWLAMYSRWLGPGPAARGLGLGTAILMLGLIGWTLWLRHRVARPEGLELSLVLVAMPFLSPQGWDYVLLVATPAVVFLVNYQDRLPRPWRVAVITALLIVGLTVHDVMGRTLYHAFMNASGITLCFVVIIGALVELRRRGMA